MEMTKRVLTAAVTAGIITILAAVWTAALPVIGADVWCEPAYAADGFEVTDYMYGPGVNEYKTYTGGVEVVHRRIVTGLAFAIRINDMDDEIMEAYLDSGSVEAQLITKYGGPEPLVKNGYIDKKTDIIKLAVDDLPTYAGAVSNVKLMIGGKSFISEDIDVVYDLSPYAEIKGLSDQVYTGSLVVPDFEVVCAGITLEKGVDYAMSLSDATNAGTATLKIRGYNGFIGEASATFQILQAENPVTVTGKTATVKYSKLKKKNQTVKQSKVLEISGAEGALTFEKTSGNKKITINKTTGKVTVKKGLKKGTYSIGVNVTAGGSENYKPGTAPATFKIKVK